MIGPQPDQMDFLIGTGDDDFVARAERAHIHAVDLQLSRLRAFGLQAENDPGFPGNDAGAVLKAVGADRGQDDTVHARINDRAAGGQRITGGSGRRGRNHPVRCEYGVLFVKKVCHALTGSWLRLTSGEKAKIVYIDQSRTNSLPIVETTEGKFYDLAHDGRVKIVELLTLSEAMGA